MIEGLDGSHDCSSHASWNNLALVRRRTDLRKTDAIIDNDASDDELSFRVRGAFDDNTDDADETHNPDTVAMAERFDKGRAQL